MGKLKRLTPDPRTTHWPRSADYPTDYSTDYPTDYSTDYPPRTTLNNQPNDFYGEEKHKKPTSSHVHDHNWKQPPFSFHRLSLPSLFHFRPILSAPTTLSRNPLPLSERRQYLPAAILLSSLKPGICNKNHFNNEQKGETRTTWERPIIMMKKKKGDGYIPSCSPSFFGLTSKRIPEELAWHTPPF